MVPPGLTKSDALPPGLERQLEEDGSLPPGLNLLQTFDDPTPTRVDLFGASVSIEANYVLIGAPGDDTNGPQVGQAHLFDATTGDLVQIFDDPTVTDQDSFGASVDIDGDNYLIGARFDNTNGINVGQAHLFNLVFPSDFVESEATAASDYLFDGDGHNDLRMPEDLFDGTDQAEPNGLNSLLSSSEHAGGVSDYILDYLAAYGLGLGHGLSTEVGLLTAQVSPRGMADPLADDLLNPPPDVDGGEMG